MDGMGWDGWVGTTNAPLLLELLKIYLMSFCSQKGKHFAYRQPIKASLVTQLDKPDIRLHGTLTEGVLILHQYIAMLGTGLVTARAAFNFLYGS